MMSNALTKKYPDRFYGMASLNPHCGKDFYWAEMRRCMKELGFVGNQDHAHRPCGESHESRWPDAFDAARELKFLDDS